MKLFYAWSMYTTNTPPIVSEGVRKALFSQNILKFDYCKIEKPLTEIIDYPNLFGLHKFDSKAIWCRDISGRTGSCIAACI